MSKYFCVGGPALGEGRRRGRGCYAAPMSSDRSPAPMTWVFALLALGALVGIGTAAALLARKDRPLPDDPDAPLFI